MEKNNVINLSNYIQKKQDVETYNAHEFKYFDLSKDKILLRRITAFSADFFIILTLFNMIQISYAGFVSSFLVPLNYVQKTNLISGSTSANIAIFAFIYMVYFLYCNYTFQGKTLGKMWMKLKVINENYIHFSEQKTHDLTLRQSMRRSLGKFLCYISLGTFFILNIMNEEKRGIPDMLSQSRVVSDEWFEAFVAHKDFDLESLKIDISSLDRVA